MIYLPVLTNASYVEANAKKTNDPIDMPKIPLLLYTLLIYLISDLFNDSNRERNLEKISLMIIESEPINHVCCSNIKQMYFVAYPCGRVHILISYISSCRFLPSR